MGFEFSYPPEITIEEADLRGDAIQGSLINPAEFNYAVTAKFNDTELVYIASSVNVNPEYLPINPQATADALKAENETDSESALGLEISAAVLDKNEAYRVESKENERLVFFLLSKGKDDTSEISISVIVEESRAQTINQIINSFKFL